MCGTIVYCVFLTSTGTLGNNRKRNGGNKLSGEYVVYENRHWQNCELLLGNKRRNVRHLLDNVLALPFKGCSNKNVNGQNNKPK